MEREGGEMDRIFHRVVSRPGLNCKWSIHEQLRMYRCAASSKRGPR
jgi:hypothetical protein